MIQTIVFVAERAGNKLFTIEKYLAFCLHFSESDNVGSRIPVAGISDLCNLFFYSSRALALPADDLATFRRSTFIHHPTGTFNSSLTVTKSRWKFANVGRVSWGGGANALLALRKCTRAMQSVEHKLRIINASVFERSNDDEFCLHAIIPTSTPFKLNILGII